MTNRIAFSLAGAVAVLLMADALWLHLGLPVRAGRMLDQVIEQMSFWR